MLNVWDRCVYNCLRFLIGQISIVRVLDDNNAYTETRDILKSRLSFDFRKQYFLSRAFFVRFLHPSGLEATVLEILISLPQWERAFGVGGHKNRSKNFGLKKKFAFSTTIQTTSKTRADGERLRFGGSERRNEKKRVDAARTCCALNDKRWPRPNRTKRRTGTPTCLPPST